MKNIHKGFVGPLLLIIIAVLVIGGGIYLYTQRSQTTATDPLTETAVSTQPSVTVLSPNGGEAWTIGSTQTIKWNSNNFSGGVVYFELIDSRYNAATEDNQTHFKIANAVPNTGSYSWTIPSGIGNQTVTSGSQYKVRISAYKTTSTGLLDYDNLVQGDVSNAQFSISNN